MTIEAALATYLSTAPGLAVLGARVYPKRLPQKPDFPAVVYHRVSGPREHSHGGPSGLARPRFELDVYARTYAGAKEAAEGIRVALDGFRGSLGGIDVSGIFLEDDEDGYDDDLRIFWWRLDVIVWHAETNG